MERDVLLAADVRALEDDALFAAAYASASVERKLKTDRYRFRGDKYSSLGAELLLRHALAGLGIREFAISYGEAGKPYLAGRDDVFFSLSHSGCYVLCAVSDREIGADIETVRSVDLKIARRFFCAGEYEHIAAQETEDARRELFFRDWTLKESFLKATGLGLRLPLNQFEIIRNDEISVVQSVDERSFSFREYDGVPGCKCAVCTAGAPFAAELQTVDIRVCLK
ncbi:MAG: 4'-phosphopantetheinyl transferase superfamily protein [Oscillospiraceae bacterium]|nr:4'-phosphopantetheinyl transferase superfamily protein [Oscillospiraceae bacterium]